MLAVIKVALQIGGRPDGWYGGRCSDGEGGCVAAQTIIIVTTEIDRGVVFAVGCVGNAQKMINAGSFLKVCGV